MHCRSSDRGYILITLLLFIALLAIAMTALAPVIKQQVKRDREEELIHRGVQYARAIKHYVKKFGRYPTRIEELENTNNIRFLRKRYKDPITGKDFKILRMGDVQMAFGGGIAGASTAATLAAASQGTGFGPGNSPAFGGSGGANASGGGAFGGNSFGGNAFGANNGPAALPNTAPGQVPGTDATQPNAGSNPDQSQGTPGTGASQGSGTQQASGGQPQVFGGGPMVGVASLSKEKSIRVFSKKDHYDKWQFIYDPNSDTGGLLMTPNQQGQSLAGGTHPAVPGNPGGVQNSPFGQPGGQQSPPGGTSLTQPPQSTPQQFPQMPPDQGPQ